MFMEIIPTKDHFHWQLLFWIFSRFIFWFVALFTIFSVKIVQQLRNMALYYLIKTRKSSTEHGHVGACFKKILFWWILIKMNYLTVSGCCSSSVSCFNSYYSYRKRLNIQIFLGLTLCFCSFKLNKKNISSLSHKREHVLFWKNYFEVIYYQIELSAWGSYVLFD